MLLNDARQILSRLTPSCHDNEIRDKVGYITRLVYEISRRSLRPTRDFRCIGLLNDVIEILPRLTLVAMAMKFETK